MVCVDLVACPYAKEARQRLKESAELSGAVTLLSLGGGMQPSQRTPRFIALDVSLEAIRVLRPVVAAIRRSDRDLEDQLRRALTSISLNLAEGNRSHERNRIARFSTAAGSCSEARAALRVALAWGYVRDSDVEAGERILDRLAGMLHGLGAER